MQKSISHRLIMPTDAVLVLSPVLAKEIGRSSAIVLQQLHYWLSHDKKYGYERDGVRWIYNTYHQWQEQIKIYSLKTIQRAFTKLETLGLIHSEHKLKSSYDKTKAYSINYDKILDYLGEGKIQRPTFVNLDNKNKHHLKLIETAHVDKMSHPIKANCPSLFNKNKHTKITSLFNDTQNSVNNQPKVSDEPTIQPALPAKRENNNFVEEMISLWNEIIEQEHNKIALNTKRIQHLRAAFKQFFNSDMSKWETFCCKIASSKFLMGEVKDFKAYLDWSIRFDTIQRILEGGYTFGDRVVNYQSKVKSCFASQNELSLKTIVTPNTQAHEEQTSEHERAIIIRKRICNLLGDTLYQTWFKNTKITINEKSDCHFATLYVSNQFIADCIRTRYRDIVEHFFTEIRVGKPHEKNETTNIVYPLINHDTPKLNLENINPVHAFSSNENSKETGDDIKDEAILLKEKENSPNVTRKLIENQTQISSPIPYYIKEAITYLVRLKTRKPTQMKGRGVYIWKGLIVKHLFRQAFLVHKINIAQLKCSQNYFGDNTIKKSTEANTPFAHTILSFTNRLKRTGFYIKTHLMQRLNTLIKVSPGRKVRKTQNFLLHFRKRYLAPYEHLCNSFKIYTHNRSSPLFQAHTVLHRLI